MLKIVSLPFSVKVQEEFTECVLTRDALGTGSYMFLKLFVFTLLTRSYLDCHSVKRCWWPS